MAIRHTYRRRLSYNTKSNKVKVVRVAGGMSVLHYVKKTGTVPKCGDCSKKMLGLKEYRPMERKSAPKKHKTVSRCYGGSLCAKCVRKRIIHALLTEEKSRIKRVMIKKRNSENAETVAAIQ